MASAIFQALKIVPASVGVKYLEKYSPVFKNYFAKVAAYGLDTNRALDYLKDRFSNEATENFKSQLEQGERKGTLRPDEMAAKTQISNAEIPGQVLRGAASLAGGFIGSGASREEEQPEEAQAQQQMQQQAQPQPQAQAPQRQQGPRELAAKRLNDMQKEKKLIQQLQADFQAKYGRQAPESPEFPTARSQPARSQGAAPRGTGDEALLAAMEKILRM